MSGIINRDTWLAALADAVQPVEDHPDALTTREFMEAFNLTNVQTAARHIAKLLEAGRLRQVRKRAAMPGGQIRLQQAYVLVEPQKAPRKRS